MLRPVPHGSLVLTIMEASNSSNYSVAFAVTVQKFQLRLVLKDLESWLVHNSLEYSDPN